MVTRGFFNHSAPWNITESQVAPSGAKWDDPFQVMNHRTLKPCSTTSHSCWLGMIPPSHSYPSGYVKMAIENGPVEIVDFPIKNGGSFHSYVSLPEGIPIFPYYIPLSRYSYYYHPITNIKSYANSMRNNSHQIPPLHSQFWIIFPIYPSDLLTYPIVVPLIFPQYLVLSDASTTTFFPLKSHEIPKKNQLIKPSNDISSRYFLANRSMKLWK